MSLATFTDYHVRQNLTSLVNTLVHNNTITSQYRVELNHVLSYIDYDGLLEDIENDDDFHGATWESREYVTEDGEDTEVEWYVHVGGETRHADDLQEVACIIADYFEIPLGNYGVPLNRWYVVSRDFFIYLGEHGERVIDWNGMYIWGTWLRSENTYPIELDMVQEYYAHILNSNY